MREQVEKLYKEIVPKAVDEYLDFIEKGKGQNELQLLLNPVWHVHNGEMPNEQSVMPFSMLLAFWTYLSLSSTNRIILK